MPDYEHLQWQRLNIPAAGRRTGTYKPVRLPVRDQAQHGIIISDSIEEALEFIQDERQKLGIDPSRMLVLEFTSLDPNYHTILEGKLRLYILSEVAIEKDLDQPFFIVEVKAPSSLAKDQLVSEINPVRFNLKRIEPVRTGIGAVDPKRAQFIFESKADASAFKDFLESGIASSNSWKVFISDKKRETYYRATIQFPDDESLESFKSELAAYNGSAFPTDLLTANERATLFDAFESVESISREDRLGSRAYTEGFPEGIFYFDIDLWHTGEDVFEEKRITRKVIEDAGGTVTDIKTVADTLILARVEGDSEVVEKLLSYDRVSRIDLPPALPPQLFNIFDNQTVPSTPQFDDDLPIACLIDSGIIAGHPLLTGAVIDSNDFDSGENSVADFVGHGTHIAGTIVYGDVTTCIASNQWKAKARVINAKVLRRGNFNEAVFGDEKRAETQIEDAVRWAATAYSCRVFNLSLGNPARAFSRGHQLPWALLIDGLARELNIVIVVSAGNSAPIVPSVNSRAELRSAVLDNIYSTNHALIDPATAANALTVGAITRTDRPADLTLRLARDVFPPVAAPPDTPSPFTRTGICDGRGGGIHRSIKPELVGYGGNYILNTGAAPPYKWIGNDAHLGEPSFAFDFASRQRLFATACGTSYAAPFVTHIAARVEHLFRNNNRTASSNLIRALVVHSARHATSTRSYIEEHRSGDTELSLLRAMGYGKPKVDDALYSSDNRVVLFAEDDVKEEQYHLYELELPEEFVRGNDRRRIRITLAYDPPIRGARKEYISRTMWFELFRDVTPAQIQAYTAKLPNQAAIKSCSLSPLESRLEWSTVQSASLEIKSSRSLRKDGEIRKFHVLVGCHQRFKSGEDPFQRYALVASLEHDKTDVTIYEAVRVKLQAQRIMNRTRLRS